MTTNTARAQDASDPLVDMLVKKGLITAEDASRLPRGTGPAERDALAELLKAKGLLTAEDIAHLQAAAPPVGRAPAKPEGAPLQATAPPIERIPAAPKSAVPVYAKADRPSTLTVGPVDLTLGGFIDYEGVYRTRNAQGFGTPFATIPFSNTPQGQTSEFRTSAQNSRLALKAETSPPFLGEKTDVAAYFEADFGGNDAPSAGVTSNPDTFRLRQAFAEMRRGRWEVLAGQAWSWLTPNRRGLGSYPEDMFLTDNFDPNYNVGLTWARQPALRFIYHPDSHWAMGLSIENPDQFGGPVTFPAAFREQLAVQVGSGASGSTIPNAAPDIIPKVSFDDVIDGHQVHLEAAGLVSFFRVAGEDFGSRSAVGYGGSIAASLELAPGLTAVASGFASKGGGRYIYALAPDIVVLPTASGQDVSVEPVTSYSGLFGLEWKLTRKLEVAAYWGFMHAEHNFALDTTFGAKPGAFVGFGYPGSPDTQNRWIREPAFDVTYTVWNTPRYGALQLGFQYSHIDREPWFVAEMAPASASLDQFWWDVRYVLP